MASSTPAPQQSGNPALMLLGRFLGLATRNADFLIAMIVVGVVVMMIIPIPVFLLDILMSLNIAISLVLVLTATYLDDPLEFSVFPSLLLITTLFRLALNISTTRLILLEGKDFDGEVVRAFGSFVVGGNYFVGIIIFAILVLVQYMVITRGSERVAEVAARFTLDAMPGKQMAIDADLGAGLIDEGTAKARREKLQKEVDFYGAMDGASKFVKGDTIAGIIITIVNIVAGMILGYMSGKFSGFAEIASTYTILTIGDGLVSIIPSLLISVAAGIVVTRSASDRGLGADVFGQMSSKPKALLIAGGLFLGLALVPGLPKVPFIVIAAALGIMGYLLFSDAGQVVMNELASEPSAVPAGGPAAQGKMAAPESGGEAAPAEDSGPEDVSNLLQVDTLELEIGYGLIPMVDVNKGGDLLNRVKMIRRQIAMELGLIVPAIRIRDNMQLGPNYYSILLKGIEIGKFEVFHDMFLAMDPGVVATRITGIQTKEPAFGLDALWIEEEQKEHAETCGYTVVDAPTVCATHLTELIKRHAGEILGRQEVKNLLDKLKEKAPAVVTAVVPEENPERVGLVQKVLQLLLKERVSIRNFTTILETIADYVSQVKDIDSLVEFVRQALARQITNDLVVNGVLNVLTIEPLLEQRMADAQQKANSIHQAMDPGTWQKLFDVLNAEVEKMLAAGHPALLVCSPLIRPHFRRLVERVSPQLTVLSYNEIVTDLQIENVGIVRLE